MIDKIQKYLWQILFVGAMLAFAFTGLKLVGETIAHGKTQTQLTGARDSFSAYVVEQRKLNAEAKDKSRANEQQLQAAADQDRKKSDETITTLRRQRDAAVAGLRDRPARPAVGANGAGLSTPAGPGSEARGCTAAQLYREDAELALGAGYDFEELRAEYNRLWDLYQRARSQDPGTAVK